jgi:hypothetical protein
MEVMNYVNTYLMVTLCDKAIKVNIALKSMVLLAMCSYVNIYDHCMIGIFLTNSIMLIKTTNALWGL